jgi:RNA polymerase sigma-70 factor (ECF subfamily)
VYERTARAAACRVDFPGRTARSNDQRAEFAAQLSRHQSQLFGYIYSLVRDLDDADDLLQQTSLVLWDKFDQFDPSRSFVGWACGVARYEVLNFLRARTRQRLYFSDELNLALIEAQESLEEERLEERRDALAGCMKKLRERDKELLEACYGRSIGIRDVALARGRSPQSVHNSLRRIRRALFECVRRSIAQGELA